jgi:hypothetical protein
MKKNNVKFKRKAEKKSIDIYIEEKLINLSL